MATYMVFGRRQYAEPLTLLTTVDAATAPDRPDVDVGDDWLELVLVPQDAAIWVVRDARLVVRAEAS